LVFHSSTITMMHGPVNIRFSGSVPLNCPHVRHSINNVHFLFQGKLCKVLLILHRCTRNNTDCSVCRKLNL